MDLAEKRRLRGRLLQQLAMTGTVDGERAPTSSTMIVDVVRTLGHDIARPELERELAYLKDKGYVDVVTFRGNAAVLMGGAVGAKLTAKGQDVVDRAITDPGIDMGPEF